MEPALSDLPPVSQLAPYIPGLTTPVAVHPAANHLYVADNGASQLVIINTATRQRLASIPVRAPIDVTLSPDNNRAHGFNKPRGVVVAPEDSHGYNANVGGDSVSLVVF
ncbi:YncE family protein [Pseudomonas khavaziana]|uniref:YncE family protein n=1 Tax=Pseudomonas khavaziana TaxID=2842351 RepID=UPI001C3D0CC1|nr:hypothetical protein [Pseudomonas khavaziana]